MNIDSDTDTSTSKEDSEEVISKSNPKQNTYDVTLPNDVERCYMCCDLFMKNITIVDTSDFDTTDSEDTEIKPTRKLLSKRTRLIIYLLLMLAFALFIAWQWYVWVL